MYDEIINEIKSNLGENSELNRRYLSSQIEKYKDHPYNEEIIKEISRMMWDCLSEDEKEEFIRISEEETPIIDILEESFPYIENGEYETALSILESFINTLPPMFEDDKVSEYHYFTNPLEEEIFNRYIGAKKEVRYIPNNQPLIDLYYAYGFLLLETNNLKESEVYLKKALKINPVSSRILLELSEIYKIKTPSFNKFFMYTTEALEYAYYPQDIARCYRNLGHFYIEENELETAAGLFNYSMKYELSPLAYKELQYIKSKGQNIDLTRDECVSLLKNKNIQVDANPFVIKTLNELANKYDSEHAFNQALYFYELLFDLTNDKNILEKINNIQKIIKY
ncbi:hypothetical protein TL18_06155 [Methanobrevibacter sp. YE315]|uniref:hypothetical protein n=1 Tax=Methanobrevibacter sp. YE315 TaxID=1609968 RepID=UPI000764D505|nr:hypothetical protein [Methanobrevibacter sp. YE315]AMD17637.1 hypothetical protein TL18_06155 [Methanobrevibacter sp. YE315]